MRALPDALEWTARVTAEFRVQARNEAARGLPVTPFMADLGDEVKVARLQAAFLAGIVLPLWRGVAELLSGLEEPCANLQTTLAHFEVRRACGEGGGGSQ